jgi:hypothetical protein
MAGGGLTMGVLKSAMMCHPAMKPLERRFVGGISRKPDSSFATYCAASGDNCLRMLFVQLRIAETDSFIILEVIRK